VEVLLFNNKFSGNIPESLVSNGNLVKLFLGETAAVAAHAPWTTTAWQDSPVS
jgi:hypothetical protein